MTTTRVSTRSIAASDDDLLTESEARALLPMSLAWYRRRRMFGDGPPFIRVSNRVFYKRGPLRERIDARGKQGS
jgi:hypothetical protein